MYETRVLSGMRPTGSLHLGHYHGVLKNWIRLQVEYPCLFFVADWHALTTDYEKPEALQKNGWEMVIDWLAAGVDPRQAILSCNRPTSSSTARSTCRSARTRCRTSSSHARWRAASTTCMGGSRATKR